MFGGRIRIKRRGWFAGWVVTNGLYMPGIYVPVHQRRTRPGQIVELGRGEFWIMSKDYKLYRVKEES